jgi:cytochrome c oxidase subunit 1
MPEKPDIHMPSPSFWPLVLAGSFLLISLGIVSSRVFSIVGIVVLLTAIAGWALENRSEVGHHD